MPEIQYPTNPNSDTAFVVQEDGTKNRALMTAPQDTSTLELPSNPNSTKGYVTIDGKKQRVILTADISGGGGSGGDQHNLGYYATRAALEEAHPTAEAGDWAIVGATDTVWIWDTDNSEWVDSDQKGQVTSVNGQTGAVVLTIPDAVQYSTMPTASADNLGKIVQFTGTTDANYTNGYFYKCVSDGQDPATYSWEAVEVQAGGGGSSYTAGTGIDITNDVISVTNPVLVNKANFPDSSIQINPTATSGMNGSNAIAIGIGSRIGIGGVAIGNNISTNAGYLSTTVGNNISNVPGYGSVNLGNSVTSTAGTLSVALSNQNSDYTVSTDTYILLNRDGTVPADRLASTTGLADGNYRLRLVMASGVPTLEWVAE